MSSNVLSSLLADVIKEKSRKELSEEQRKAFYADFASSIDSTVEKMREEKRSAYEQLKNIAIY